MDGMKRSAWRWGLIALVLAASPGSAAAMPPIPLPRPGSEAPPVPTDEITAEFTIYLGGFLFAIGTFSAHLEGEDYRLDAHLSTAGLPRAFYEADFKLSSEGTFEAARVRPHRYISDSWDKSSARKVTLDYDGDRMPHLSATPPYDPGDLSGVMPYQQIDTQDPISTVLVPVEGTRNPCDRSIPVFDGRRRYDLKLSFDSEVKMTPRGLGRPVTAIACNIRYVPVAPVERRKFTEMLRKNDSMKVWLAPFDSGRVYMPVRLQLRTPLGGAVAELAHAEERTGSSSAH